MGLGGGCPDGTGHDPQEAGCEDRGSRTNECRSLYERVGHKDWPLEGDGCLPHQFTALSSDPKRGKARSELYIRDAALARFET